MLSNLGIGARLFLAFLGITALSLLPGVAGWLILREISHAQTRLNTEALPAVVAAQRTAETSARLVAAAPALTLAHDEASRAKQEAELFSLADEILKSVTEARFSSLDKASAASLAGPVDALVSNLSVQSRLVKERLELQRNFSDRAERTIAAATAIVDLSETLVSNASSGTSAVVASLYGLIDDPARHKEAYDALDRLIEEDIYLLDRMWELRLRSSQIGLLINRLTRAIDRNDVADIAGGYGQHMRVVHRRVASIDDPVRRAQAASFLTLLDAANGSAPFDTGLFSERLRLLEIDDELERVAEDNRNLSANVSHVAQNMINSSEAIARTISAQAERAVNAGLYVLVLSSLIAILISGLIVWLYVERGIVRHLASLANAMQRLTDGDLSVEVEYEGTRELKALSSAVVAFRDESKQRRALESERERTNEELRRHREELQELIGERTEQLQREVAGHAEARERAEAASRAKSDFLATMAHEIRTPMTGMLGMLRILNDSTLGPAQRKRLSVAASSGEALFGILDNILDTSKIESGKISLDPVVFSLRETLRGIVELMRPAAREKNLTLSLIWDSKLAPLNMGDAGKLRQIVFNLVSNAIKFTPRGGIRIVTRLIEENGNAQTVGIAVSDTGIGIPGEEQEHIFETFTQTDASVTRRYGGTGLGLAISRGFARALGGSLSVKSATAKGSTFELKLTLPAAADDNRKRAARTSKSRRGDHALRIMVVEDDEATRLVAARFLKDMGHRVIEVADGYLAVEAAIRRMPDLVLMDISLPGMDGIETAARLRQAAGDRRVPILAMSAHVFKDEIEHYLASGMDAYVGKPLTPEGLARAMAALMGGDVRRPQADHVDRSAIGADIKALGHETVLKILSIVENTLPQRFADMGKALAAGDMRKLASIAHATRSSAASAGFTSLCESAGALEVSAQSRRLAEARRHLANCEDLYRRAIAEARRLIAEDV